MILGSAYRIEATISAREAKTMKIAISHATNVFFKWTTACSTRPAYGQLSEIQDSWDLNLEHQGKHDHEAYYSCFVVGGNKSSLSSNCEGRKDDEGLEEEDKRTDTTAPPTNKVVVEL